MKKALLVSAFTVLVFSDYTYANAGVPIIFLGFPAMVCLLIPVILIEWKYLSKHLDVSSKLSLKAVAFANLASTLIGYPIAWSLMLVLQFLTVGGEALGLNSFLTKVASVTLQGAWLIPYEEDLGWMIPLAGFTSLLFAFPITLWIEQKILLRILKLDQLKVKTINLKMNLISYGLLSGILFFRLFWVWFS